MNTRERFQATTAAEMSQVLLAVRTCPDRGSRNHPNWRLERWQSGRMHRTRNAAAPVSARGGQLCNILFSLEIFATPVHPISACVVRCHRIG